jgi:MFS family permease
MSHSEHRDPSEEKRSDAFAQNQKLGFKNVVRLGYVSLFTDFSTEMILGVLPLFIHDQLGASYAIVGLIEGSAEAVNDFFRVLTGVITDRVAKRKPLVALGYALSSFAKPLFAFTSSWPQALAVRVTDRAGKGARTSPRDALISDSVQKSQGGKAFGVHQSLDQIGAVAGPLLAFLVFPLIGFRGIFWLSFAPATVSLLILLFFVKESVGLRKQTHLFKDARRVLNRRFVCLLAVLGVFLVGAYNYSFILLRASSLGVPDGEVPLVYVVINAVTVGVAFPCGVLADKVGKIPVILLSYVAIVATSVAGILLVGNWLFGFAIACLFGIYLGIAETVQRALIPDFTTADLKGTAYALYYLLLGIGSLLANFVFGYLWTVIGASAAFEYTIATSIAGGFALTLFWLTTESAGRGRLRA